MRTAPISVVIPSYNSGRLVTEAINSVLAQAVVPRQILIVDDGSTDDTETRLAAYLGRITYIRQKNQGVSAARNRGLREASGEFVAFLDADDVWHPRKIELQMQVFDRHPELGLLGTRLFDWPAESFPAVEGAPDCRATFIDWSDLVVKNYFATSSVIARRGVLDWAGPFDTTLQGPEDRDLWLRVAEFAPVANLELPLTGYRDVPGSVSKQAMRCQLSMLRILNKLDQRGAWRGRWLLRRKAYSYVYHSCCYLHGAAGHYPRALLNSLKSVLWYPLPYRRREVKTGAERPKQFLVTLLRWCGLKSSDGSYQACAGQVKGRI